MSFAPSSGPQSASEILPLVYDELRKLAAQKLAQENPGLTLQATALVHEAYVRLVGAQSPPVATGGLFANRAHFFAAAAEAMRRILVEQARRRNAAKRGGDAERVDLCEWTIAAPESDIDVLALNDALDRLAATDPAAAELVKLRYFTGLTAAEAADALGMPVRSAHDLWAYARSWLRREMAPG